MNFKRPQILATVAVAALMSIAFTPSKTEAAAVTPTVNVNLTTNSAVTVVDGVDMQFGTWFLVFRNADLFSLRVSPVDGSISTVGLGGGTADSQAINTIPGSQAGTVTVSLPTGINGVVVNMQRTATVNFTDTNISLTNIMYDTAQDAGATGVVMTPVTNYPVTIVAGGTPETVRFGADIAVTGTPADGVHTASFDVSFAY